MIVMENALLYDPKFDLSDVDQFGFVDLRKSYAEGVVSGDVAISDESFNEAPPDALLNRPDDIFAAYRQRDYVRKSLEAARSQNEPVTE